MGACVSIALVQDLEAALQNDQAAIAQTPEGHPDLAGRLQNLANSFRDHLLTARPIFSHAPSEKNAFQNLRKNA